MGNSIIKDVNEEEIRLINIRSKCKTVTGRGIVTIVKEAKKCLEDLEEGMLVIQGGNILVCLGKGETEQVIMETARMSKRK